MNLLGDVKSIYYLGGKSGMLPAIKSAIEDVDPTGGPVCDLFSGSGVVGAALAASRDVTAVDIQEYARVLSSAFLNPVTITPGAMEAFFGTVAHRASIAAAHLSPLLQYEDDCTARARSGDSERLIEFLEAPPLGVEGPIQSIELIRARDAAIRGMSQSGLWTSLETVMMRQFGGVYFSFHQTLFLDSALSVIFNEVDTASRDTYLAACLVVASQVVNSIGKQFAQPLKLRTKSGAVKPALVNSALRDRGLDVVGLLQINLSRFSRLRRTNRQHASIRQDYLAALNEHGRNFSVVYADPPYTRDHYSRFYHVLETMCLRDDPAVSIVRRLGKSSASRGLYRSDRHQSPFCIRSAAPAALDSLVASTKQAGASLVLSYSPHEADDGTHPRVLSTNQIIDITSQYYKKVDLVQVPKFQHNILNRSDLRLIKREHAEIIVKCYARA